MFSQGLEILCVCAFVCGCLFFPSTVKMSRQVNFIYAPPNHNIISGHFSYRAGRDCTLHTSIYRDPGVPTMSKHLMKSKVYVFSYYLCGLFCQSLALLYAHVIKFGLMGLQRRKCESVCTVWSQVASREVAHRLDRPRGMLFLCGVRPPALCSETRLRGCCTLHRPEAKNTCISKQIILILSFTCKINY